MPAPTPGGRRPTPGRTRRRRLQAIAAVLLLAACAPDRDTSVYTPVTELEFADVALRQCVRDAAAAAGWRTAGAVTHLQCNAAQGRGIRELAGMEALVNLEDVNLAHNDIRDPAPLAGLRRLVRLDLGFNHIERITALPRAYHVDLNHNRLTSLSWVAESPAVRTLLIEYNQITDLAPVHQLPQLVELRVSGNRLTSLGGLETARRLRYLDAAGNRLADLAPLRGLEHLSRVAVAGNRIDDVEPLRGLAALRTLDLSDNAVRDVDPLSSLVNLKTLNVAGNPLRHVRSLLTLSEIHELDLRDTPDLDCGEVRLLIDEFGSGVVRADRVCAEPAGTREADP